MENFQPIVPIIKPIPIKPIPIIKPSQREMCQPERFKIIRLGEFTELIDFEFNDDHHPIFVYKRRENPLIAIHDLIKIFGVGEILPLLSELSTIHFKYIDDEPYFNSLAARESLPPYMSGYQPLLDEYGLDYLINNSNHPIIKHFINWVDEYIGCIEPVIISNNLDMFVNTGPTQDLERLYCCIFLKKDQLMYTSILTAGKYDCYRICFGFCPTHLEKRKLPGETLFYTLKMPNVVNNMNIFFCTFAETKVKDLFLVQHDQKILKDALDRMQFL